MSDSGSSNPFSTRFTRPGALAFRFPAGDSLAARIELLRTNGWWGEIVGPHGSGKTTLLTALVPALAAAGRRLIVFELHAGERHLPEHRQRLSVLDDESIVVVDGCEQLGRFARWRLQRTCRARGSGLLVTTHHSLGLPRLFATKVEPDLAVNLTRVLLAADTAISDDDVRMALAAQRGDLREAFFALYDLYELRRRREV